jgi:hypothetical protein
LLDKGEGEEYLIVDVAILGERITSGHAGAIVGDSIDGGHVGGSTMNAALAWTKLKLKRGMKGNEHCYMQLQPAES